ncbi:MAG: family 20 glycosylhydrolase [Mucilaginibacter polytrichastri]|nr:family 20 glycosylhydrolase [Mucilaginibacter polytrichastri]
MFLLLGLRAAAQIIPAPAEQVQAGGYFVLDKKTELFSPVKTGDSVLRRFYQTLTGLSLVSAKNRGEKGIVLQIDSQLLKAKEAYRLDISAKQILIRGHDEAGLFYGFMSMLQQISEGEKGSLRIRCGTVNDQPRFAYRGMMLDVCRRFFPTETLKHWLDVLAFYKINTFHWHLTDDQGWRIEIKKYPELQSKSAWRNETLIGHKKELPHRFDGKKYGGYYTQEQVKELVKYAADRHITVIPEIEMPGHAQAALAAYPQLGCTGGPYQTATFWGIFDDVYCAGNEETFDFLQRVLDEVIPLFPSKYIHIGGDECPKTRWKACPKCQKRIADEHLKDEHELQTYFIGRMEKYVNAKGKSIIGWDEILEGGLTPNSTIMSWRGESGGIAAAKQHHDVIMTPDNYVYLDYYQSLSPDEPVAAGGYLPLSKIYNWEPLPDSLSAEEKTYIKGVQTNAWSEYFVDKKQADYMLFPRVLALSETAWSAHGRKEYAGFLARVRAHQKKLARFGVQGFPYFDEITDEPRCDAEGLSVALSTTLPGAEIRYTLNESTPGRNSLRYTGKLPVKRALTIKAQPFLNGRAQQRVYVRSFDPSATTGKKIILKTAPQGAHAHPAITLVNGIEGTNRYNDGQWLGFSGADLDATVDLGAEKMISEIGISILHYPWQKMWAPVKLSFAFSTDGRHFETVYTKDKFSVNGINRIRQKITARKVRYIRVHGVNKGLIPSGAYGAGGKAWLLADEIYAN